MYETKAANPKVHVSNNSVLGILVIVIIVRILGKYIIIGYLDPYKVTSTVPENHPRKLSSTWPRRDSSIPLSWCLPVTQTRVEAERPPTLARKKKPCAGNPP